MTKDQIYLALSAVVTTLAELPGPQPRIMVHMALQERGRCSPADCYELETIMQELGLISATQGTIEITDQGKELAEKLESALA